MLFVRRCFLEQINVRHDHPPAAVPLDLQIVKNLLRGFFWFFTNAHRTQVLLTPFLVLLVLGGNNRPAGKTTDWDNHASSPIRFLPLLPSTTPERLF
jgi:hypothetical protein